MTRIAVFASGRGSNFQALLEAEKRGEFPGKIVLLITDRADAGALTIAEAHGVKTRVIEPVRKRGRLDRATEESYLTACREAEVRWICLAGFMRILGETILDAYSNRVLNIHPSLLPAFPGLDAQMQAWDYGVRISGCTVHLVDQGIDSGPVILQRSVQVTGDADELAASILIEEHRLYPEALKIILEGSWRREGRRIVFRK
jgi:phosphoribosylglycinamide formyltransferase 1